MSLVVQTFEFKFRSMRDLNQELLRLQSAPNNTILNVHINGKTAYIVARVEIEAMVPLEETRE